FAAGVCTVVDEQYMDGAHMLLREQGRVLCARKQAQGEVLMADNGKKSNGGDNGKDKQKLTTKKYEKQLAKLHVELVKLQEWVKAKGIKVCIVFEGRDGAGKGGTIKAITERVSPRIFRVIALPAPTEREKSQMYVQRYLPHLPAAGGAAI